MSTKAVATCWIHFTEAQVATLMAACRCLHEFAEFQRKDAMAEAKPDDPNDRPTRRVAFLRGQQGIIDILIVKLGKSLEEIDAERSRSSSTGSTPTPESATCGAFGESGCGGSAPERPGDACGAASPECCRADEQANDGVVAAANCVFEG